MAPLYHVMSYEKAENVFVNNAMPARWEHDIPGYGKLKGNSFTRNKNPEMFPGRFVRLTMNQQALASRHKIIPLDGEHVFSLAWRWETRTDRKLNAPNATQLAEEFVVGDISPLHRMISHIEIREANFYLISGREAICLLEFTQAYSEKYNIPLTVNPEFIRQVESIKQRWADEEEED